MDWIRNIFRKKTPINTWARDGKYISLRSDKSFSCFYSTDDSFRPSELGITFDKFKRLETDERGQTKVKVSYKKEPTMLQETNSAHEEYCHTFQNHDSLITMIDLKKGPILNHFLKDMEGYIGKRYLEIEHLGIIEIPVEGFAIAYNELEIKRLKTRIAGIKRKESQITAIATD